MSKSWPTVRLGEVLRRSEETIELQPDTEYRQITVKLWGKGVVLRGILTGAEIAASRQMVARSGQFILSRIDARNGALGIVPPELNEAIVTNDFPTFNVVERCLLPAYLGWMCRTESFVEECKRASEGTTNRVRLQEDKFLAREISLPSLPEQRRIVARIEELAAQIEEAKALRKQAAEDAGALLLSGRNRAFAEDEWPSRTLDEVAPINMGQSPPGTSYNDNGDGVPLLNGPTEFGEHHPTPTQWTSAPTKLCKPDDILLCVRGATTGRMNWADREYCIGRGLAALTANTGVCTSEYVYHLVATRTREMLALAAGSTFPNLPGAKLKKLKVSVPPLSDQRRIVAELDALQAEVDKLKRLQAETSAELDALLPSILDQAFKGKL